MALKAGFLGLCEIDGLKVRVTDFNVNVRQEVQFYEHIVGLRDSIPSGLFPKRDDGSLNEQRTFWRPGVKICAGSISFPATIENLEKTFDLVKRGDDFTLKFNYTCNDVERTFEYCKINSFVFTATAGDIPTIQIDIMGRHIAESTGSNLWDDSQKLLTWDRVKITSISKDPAQMFTFNVNNNCLPIYTAGANDKSDLFPKKIRVGMQHVTGTIVYYVKGKPYEDLDKNTKSKILKIKIEDKCVRKRFDETLCVVYRPIERASNIGALLHTLPFVGVGKALGT
jgi:hypothetical protein